MAELIDIYIIFYFYTELYSDLEMFNIIYIYRYRNSLTSCTAVPILLYTYATPI